MKKLLCLPVLALAVLLMGAPNALADTATCSGLPVPGSPVVGDLDVTGFCNLPNGGDYVITGNVRVLALGELSITGGVTIHGDLKVEPGGSIFMMGINRFVEPPATSSVGGNVQLKGPAHPVVRPFNAVFETMIGGDLQVEEGTATTTLFGNTLSNGNLQVFKRTGETDVVFNTIINGNLQVFENTGDISVEFNQIANGDLQVFKNTGDTSVMVNTITNGDLQCKENDGDFSAKNNVVSGNTECDDS